MLISHLMFKADEIRRNVSGAWKVMKGDASGVAQLDTSFEGFWRSFAVFILILPVFALATLSRFQVLGEQSMTVGSDTIGYVVALLISQALEWVAFPAILALAARPLRFDQNYVQFIVIRNWASLIFAGIYALPLLLHVMGVIPTGLITLAGLIILIAATYFLFRITRIGLQVDGAMAAGIVAFDFVLTLAIADLVPDPYPIPS